MSSLKFGFVASNIVEEGRVSNEDINYLTNWLLGEKLITLTNEQLVLFLLSGRSNLEATKARISAFNYIRNSCPHLFTNRDFHNKELKKANKTIDIFNTSEKHTKEGFSLAFGRLRDTYYGNFEIEPCTKLLFMNIDSMVYDVPPNGFIVVFDMKGLGFMHLTRLSPSVLRPFFRYVQEGLPVSLEAVHVLNSNYLVTALMKIISPFMNPDLMNKLHFHPPSTDMNHFYDTCVPKNLMPEDYGGDLPPVRQLHDKTVQKLIELKLHFDAEEKQRCDILKQ